MPFSPLHTRNITQPFPLEAFKKTQEQKSYSKISAQPDPSPENGHNKEKTAVGLAGMAIGGLGIWYAGKTLYNLIPTWKGSNVSPSGPGGVPESESSGWAKALYSLPGSQALPMLYVGNLSFRALCQGILNTMGAAEEKERGRLDLRSVYRDVHQEGIQGQGLKVGVLDVFPDKKPFQPNQNEKLSFKRELSDLLEIPHGTAVSNVIHSAAPKADIIHFPILKASKTWAEMDRVAAEYKEKPEQLTYAALRKGLQPTIADMAIQLKAAVDKGVNAINVSLVPEQLLDSFVKLEIAESNKALQRRCLKMAIWGEPDLVSLETASARHRHLAALFSRKQDLDDRLNPISKDLMAIYQPWYDALEYAAKKNVLVVIASGNSGNAPEPATLAGLSHINPLGLKQPALHNVIVVGSTNEQGELSEISSEYNNKIQPTIAANGSGQINTRGGVPGLSTRLARKNPTAPIWVAQTYHNGPGTSFAAPDITGLYVLAQSARRKDGKPPLSFQDFHKVLGLAAQPVAVDPIRKISHEVSAGLQTKAERDELDLQRDKRNAVWEILCKRHEEPGLEQQEWKERSDCSNNFYESFVEPLYKQHEELKNFEDQLAQEFQREEILRKTGPHGSIAGRRLHALSIARQYRTEHENAQSLLGID